MPDQIIFLPDKTLTLKTENEIITYAFASFWSRVAARIIDSLIIFLPGYIIPLLPSWLYWSLQHSHSSQSTVGQKALGLKTLSIDGQPISFGQATGRFFSNFLNALTLSIGIFMMLFNDKRQCLHDYISGCIVVKEINRLPSSEPRPIDNKPITI